MLMKLLKHEFRATSRSVLPLMLFVLMTAIGAHFSIAELLDSDVSWIRTIGGIFMAAFIIALIAGGVIVFVMMIQRFKKNLLGDEAYLSMMLPVSVSQQVFAKLLVSVIWYLLIGIVLVAGIGIVIFDLSTLDALKELVGEMMQVFGTNNLVTLAGRVLLLFLTEAALINLQIYAAMAIGHSFNKHKMGWSVAAYVVFQMIFSFLGTANLMMIGSLVGDQALGGVQLISKTLGGTICVSVLYAVLFYGVTVYFLKKHFNLE